VHDWINEKNFPLVSKDNPANHEIEICDPDSDFTIEEGVAFLEQRGLSRPTYEHALRFAREHGTATSSSMKPFVVFLHEPWEDANHDLQVMYIDRECGNRWLTLECIKAGFDSHCVLAGIRPRK